MRPRFAWDIGRTRLELGARTFIMGIVNVTPNSFSDGGQFYDRGRAVEHALQLLDEGADIVDVGGESTRPGTRVEVRTGKYAIPLSAEESWARKARIVTADEELRRVIPVITELRHLRPEAVISVDTYKATVARATVEAGADIINDVSGLLWDGQMAKTAAQLRCGLVLMHMRGLPEQWRHLPPIGDAIGLVLKEMGQRTTEALRAGIRRERIVIDPGIGFGKNYEENYPLLAGLGRLQELGFPILTASSRKSFVGKAISRGDKMPPPQSRLYGSLAAMVISIVNGAHIVRIHDVKPAVDAARMTDAILNAAGKMRTAGRKL